MKLFWLHSDVQQISGFRSFFVFFSWKFHRNFTSGKNLKNFGDLDFFGIEAKFYWSCHLCFSFWNTYTQISWKNVQLFWTVFVVKKRQARVQGQCWGASWLTFSISELPVGHLGGKHTCQTSTQWNTVLVDAQEGVHVLKCRIIDSVKPAYICMSHFCFFQIYFTFSAACKVLLAHHFAIISHAKLTAVKFPGNLQPLFLCDKKM